MDPTLARIFCFDEESLAANRGGRLHEKQVRFLLSSPSFQGLLNLFAGACALGFLVWSWSNHRPTGFVGPLALLIIAVSAWSALGHLKRSRQFQQAPPDLKMETVTGEVQLEKLSVKKERGRGARELRVGGQVFLLTKGAHQQLQVAEGQQLRVYWCEEPVHHRKHVLSAEFVS